MRIIDTHHLKKIDLDKVVDFVILKCSQGTSFADPKFQERRDYFRKKGLYIGSYHFAGKYVNGINIPQDPLKEADWYLKNVGEIKEGELLILDWEVNHKDPVDWCQKFLDRIKSNWIYTNDYRAKKYPFPKDWKFWIARYPQKDNGTMQLEPSFKNWSIWQFSSKGIVDGVEGNCDLNYTPLSLPELIGNIAPTPPSEPTIGFTKYSQQDPRWKDDKIGNSKWTLGVKGCVVCSVCTLASWFGETITPKELASHKELFTLDGLMIWTKLNGILKTLNFGSRIRFFNESMIDLALKNSETCVLLNVDFGYHFVGALKKTYLGYTTADSFPMPTVNRNYKNRDVVGFVLFIKK